ncbi:MAG: AraC family transcriptional regulator ligand-binding domain-containing protein [Bermanella sp.]
MQETPFVNSSFLSQFGELVLSRGGDANALAQAVGLPSEAINGAHMPIPFSQFIALLELAAEELNFPDISFSLAQRQDITILGPLGIMLDDCQTVADALVVIQQYMNIIVSGIKLQISENKGLLELCLHCNLPALYDKPQFQYYLLASILKVIREIIGQKYRIRGCFFTRTERDIEKIKRFTHLLGCPVGFGSDQIKITIDSAVLQESTLDIRNYITSRMRSFMDSQEEFLKQVSAVISIFLPSGKTDINSIAKSMGYSARTLQRRLNDSSSSFKYLLDSVRLTHANQYLKNTQYSLTDIAILLGYSNLSAFTRAYHRWHGINPRKARHIKTAPQKSETK